MQTSRCVDRKRTEWTQGGNTCVLRLPVTILSWFFHTLCGNEVEKQGSPNTGAAQDRDVNKSAGGPEHAAAYSRPRRCQLLTYTAPDQHW
jgi:hypothetical protein